MVGTQADPRFKKRLPCRLRVAGSSHAAMVLNVSRGGLFVQTSAGPPPGAGVEIDLDMASRAEAVPIGARVVWTRVVAPHLRTISPGGVGVRIESAPEAYYRFLSAVAGEASASPPCAGRESAGPAPEAQPPEVEFRVRVKQAGGSRSRTLTFPSQSEAEARAKALRIAGEGWVILELERSA